MKYLLMILFFFRIAHANPLHDAVIARDQKLVRKLIKEGHDINAQLTKEELQRKSHKDMVIGDTPLIIAVRLNLKEIVNVLAEPADLVRLQAQFKMDQKKLVGILDNIHCMREIRKESEKKLAKKSEEESEKKSNKESSDGSDDQEQKKSLEQSSPISQVARLQRQNNSKDLSGPPKLQKQQKLSNVYALTPEEQEIDRRRKKIIGACWAADDFEQIFKDEFEEGLEKLLHAANANPNIPNSIGSTPLLEAVRNYTDNLEIIGSLVGAGADINAIIAENKTIIEHAKAQQKLTIVGYLKHFSIKAQIRITSHKDRVILDGNKPNSYIDEFLVGRFTNIKDKLLNVSNEMKSVLCENSLLSGFQADNGRNCETPLGASVARIICQGWPGFEASKCVESSPNDLENAPLGVVEGTKDNVPLSEHERALKQFFLEARQNASKSVLNSVDKGAKKNDPFEALEKAKEHLTKHASLGEICSFMSQRLPEGASSRDEIWGKCKQILPDWRELYLNPFLL